MRAGRASPSWLLTFMFLSRIFLSSCFFQPAQGAGAGGEAVGLDAQPLQHAQYRLHSGGGFLRSNAIREPRSEGMNLLRVHHFFDLFCGDAKGTIERDAHASQQRR